MTVQFAVETQGAFMEHLVLYMPNALSACMAAGDAVLNKMEYSALVAGMHFALHLWSHNQLYQTAF